jgi:hypothetical protein
MTIRTLALALLAPLAAACHGTRLLVDPTVIVAGERAAELGVATDYGVVFLGREVRAGEVEVTAWFGDGPSVEPAVVEPVGAGVYTAATEIRLPSVPLSFRTPAPGSEVVVRGRYGSDVWEERVRVAADPRVQGLLLELPERLRDAPDQVGAGVFVEPERGRDYERERQRRVIGLVSGRLLIEGEGGTKEYLTVVGPTTLWRLAAHRRDRDAPTWIYRPDVL